MSTGALIAFVVLLISWSLLSGRLERLDVSGPIIFVVVGLVLCNGPWAVVDVSIETSAVHVLSEITLALLLFADAARINPQDLRHSAGLPIRLLAFGLPLTFAIGFGVAALLFTGLPWELAALLGAVLAPTDAALSASIVSDASLPQSIRRSLNVESGLNDGIATPVVTALIAGSARWSGSASWRTRRRPTGSVPSSICSGAWSSARSWATSEDWPSAGPEPASGSAPAVRASWR